MRRTSGCGSQPSRSGSGAWPRRMSLAVCTPNEGKPRFKKTHVWCGRMAPSAREESVEQAHELPAPLTEREREILAFERSWWKQGGSKERAVRDAFDMSATRYYQILNALIDTPAALEEDPRLVRRLPRHRVARRRQRAACRLG